jgi:trehalose synthase
MENRWRRYNEMNASLFRENYDFIIVHDPQPAALLSTMIERLGRRPKGKWIWDCHLDLSQAQLQARTAFEFSAGLYDEVVVGAPGYLTGVDATVIPPAIDPLNSKNVPLTDDLITDVLVRHGLDPMRPLICQLSTFNRGNDPLGLIDVFRRVRTHVPGLQLALVSNRMADDPEINQYFREVVAQANSDPDIFFFSSGINQLGNTEINALLRGSQVVVQRSVRRGFAIGLLEASWKEKPVVAGLAGELPRQVQTGSMGFLVESDDECAERLAYLLERPEERRKMGEQGKERIREGFLVTRHLRDYLELLNGLAG